MKKINITLIFLYLIAFISCKSQQILPLNTNLDGIPANGAYLKDLNNELAPYIGTYTTTYQGK